MRIKYELILWYNAILKALPGNIGCWIRIRSLPIKAGKGVKIWDDVHIDSPSKLSLGNNVSINRGTVINCGGNVIIGDDVLIGPKVTIYSQNHNFEFNGININKQGYSLKEVVIGNNVWIAANSIILPGVSISNNVVIGAGSVVTKSISEEGVYFGNPLRKK